MPSHSPLTYQLIRSRRRKRSLSLNVTRSGTITVRAPLFTPKLVIDQFVASKSAWIKRHLLASPVPASLTPLFPNKEALITHLTDTTHHYSKLMDVTPQGLKFKKVKSYWGNCSPKGLINFNLELIYAPTPVVDYVVIHELAHLKYRGHGKRFWSFVREFCPTANDSRRFLRQLSRDLRG